MREFLVLKKLLNILLDKSLLLLLFQNYLNFLFFLN